jgi:nitrogen fixation NifU-like protein
MGAGGGQYSPALYLGLIQHQNPMNKDLQKQIETALADPKNMGEMPDADSVGTVGNADCGEMLRLWIKFKEDNGRKVIEKASFQSFGCETAIAVASLATELIRGKTREEALQLNSADLSDELGPLPPMKIHCAQLVEGALRSALDPAKETAPATAPNPGGATAESLADKMSQSSKGGLKINFLGETPG